MLRSKISDDCGSASLEFITAGLVLLVPLVYLILTVSTLQSATLASEGAARQAARVFVTADDEREALARASRAVQVTLEDYGFSADAARMTTSCSPTPDSCLERRGMVSVSVELSVALPLAPPVASFDAPLALAVNAAATQQVSRFWGTR